VRPTSELVREAIFDVLGDVSGLRVLDLFAGTGALGLEALSRGAAWCVFVEQDAKVAAVLRANIANLGYENACRVIGTDFRRALTSLAGRQPGSDLLFVDPPYRMLAEVEVTLTPLLTSLSSPAGVVVIEGQRSSDVTFGQPSLFVREYGETKVTMVKMRRGDP
jgi:16S rRNA (guanine966-N2)-methyltransferase